MIQYKETPNDYKKNAITNKLIQKRGRKSIYKNQKLPVYYSYLEMNQNSNPISVATKAKSI